MSESNGQNGVFPQGEGGSGDHPVYRRRGEMVMELTALNRYDLSPEVRQHIINGAMRDSNHKNSRIRDRARKILLMADSIDARRERTDVQRETSHQTAAVSLIREMLRTFAVPTPSQSLPPAEPPTLPLDDTSSQDNPHEPQ